MTPNLRNNISKLNRLKIKPIYYVFRDQNQHKSFI